MEFRVDSRTGPLVGTVSISDTTNTWRAKFTAMSLAITGLHDLYVNVISTSDSTNLMDIDMFRFIEAVPSTGVTAPMKTSSMRSIARSAEHLFVHSPGSNASIVRLQANTVCAGVYSVAGRKMQVDLSGNGTIVNVSKLPAGVYIIGDMSTVK